MGDGFAAIGVTQASLSAALDLDQDQRRAVPRDGAVRFGLVGRHLVGRNVNLLDGNMRRRRGCRHDRSFIECTTSPERQRRVPATRRWRSGLVDEDCCYTTSLILFSKTVSMISLENFSPRRSDLAK